MRQRALTLAVLATLALSGAGACRSRQAAKGEGQMRPITTVRVENRAFLDMNVYVVRGGGRIRLGMVTGNSTMIFRLSRDAVAAGGRLRFLADPVGSGRTPVSEEIDVFPGEQVVLVIPPM